MDKPVPSAPEIEQSILAAAIIRPESIPEIADDLDETDFYVSKHRLIWSAIKHLNFFKEPIELVTVAQQLKDSGKIDQAGGAHYLSQIVDTIPQSTTLEYHVKILKEKRALRDSIEMANAVMKRAYSEDPAAETIEYMHQVANKIEIAGGVKDLKTMDTLAEESADNIAEVQSANGNIMGARSGFAGLDNLTNGFQKGDLFIIAARPSMGKTAIAINMAKFQTSRGIPTGVFSLEQPARQLFNRMLADMTNLDSMRFYRGGFTQEELSLINEAQGRLWEYPMWIDDKGALTVEEICSRARRYQKLKGLRVLYIDHLQLSYANRKFNTRNDELGYITSRIRGLAKDLDITAVVLSQLNRSLESRPNPHKRPRLSDLRDSGNIEQDADLVGFLYRPEAYGDKESMKWPGYAELNIAKHRNGPTGAVDLTWEKEFTRFRESTNRYDPSDYPV